MADELHIHLDAPAVRATLSAMKFDNPYKWLAGKVREVAQFSAFVRAFDWIISALRELVGLIQHRGTAAMGSQAGRLLPMVVSIRHPADLDIALGERRAIGWSYASVAGESVSLVGVPVLKNNIYVSKD